MQYNKDRRFSRHGSNIFNPSESSGDFLNKSSLYETIVVIDFVTNPIEFLSEKIDIIDLSNENFKKNKTAENKKNVINKIKESLRRENKFSNIKDSLSKESRKDRRENRRNRRKNKLNPNQNAEDDQIDLPTKNVTRLEAYTSINSSEKVVNSDLVSIMPRNSIIGINIGRSDINSSSLEIFFPFFSSHLCLPVKPGEHVWCFYDNVGGRKIGYWVSRKTGLLPVEDVNYTHNDRHNNINEAIYVVESKNFKYDLKKQRLKKILSQFNNSITNTDMSSTPLKNRDYDDIIINSKSYNEDFVGQAVPRYDKKSSDLLLQGSNNTIIAMTHDGEKNSGNIILAAGRPTPETSVIKNIRSFKAKFYEYEEEDKTQDVITEANLQKLKKENIIKNNQYGNIEQANSYLMLKENGSIDLKSHDIYSWARNFNIISTDTLIQGSNTNISCDNNLSAYTSNTRIECNDTMTVKALKIGMNGADEPYVVHSELEKILDAIIGDIAAISLTLDNIYQATLTPPVTGDGGAALGLALTTAFDLSPELVITDNSVLESEMNKIKSKTIFGSK